MNISLSIPDILLFTTSILLVFNIILLLKKVNSKNYMLVGTLAIYFSFITATTVLLLFTRYNIKIINSGTILTLMTIVYSLYNVFHYFSLQQLIVKKNRFNIKYLLHLVAVIIFGILIFYFFQHINFIKGKGYSYIF